jgi:anti-sigma factor ChrR (cupin superfamily)
MSDMLSADELSLLDAVMAEGISPVVPPPSVRGRVMDAVRHTRTVRADEGRWLRLVEGVTVKPLSIDEKRGTVTLLMTLQPGARVAGHDHHGAEDSFVVSGSCHIGATHLAAGDFHHASGGTHHGEIVSETGCTLLLVVDRRDYELAA